ncbi:hypothetical protein FKP32DRAFT_657139 [Trametes sanguinea]|nr:hypothetical protein FKP32DRAFT_657139 [Trametes sanguinea]
MISVYCYEARLTPPRCHAADENRERNTAYVGSLASHSAKLSVSSGLGHSGGASQQRLPDAARTLPNADERRQSGRAPESLRLYISAGSTRAPRPASAGSDAVCAGPRTSCRSQSPPNEVPWIPRRAYVLRASVGTVRAHSALTAHVYVHIK